MKTAVIFSGQGAQFSGMGKSFYENCAASREILDKIPSNLREICFEGTKEDLSKTEITQPGIYAVNMAGFVAVKEVLDSKNLAVDMVAGFSLGEYSALCAAGVFNFETGFELVSRRGEFMKTAAEQNPGAMVAALGDLQAIEKLVKECEDAGLILCVNYNCPGQTVVAGEVGAIDEFVNLAKPNGIRAIKLPVSGAFHSPLMNPAFEKLSEEIEKLNLAKPTVDLYSNITGEIIDSENLAANIARQVISPVKWEKSIKSMITAGAELFIEVGVGSTLTKFMSKIDDGVKAVAVSSVEDLAKLEELIN